MEYKLTKLKKEILKIEPIKVEFEDTYSTIHLRQYYVDKWKLTPPCTVEKAFTPTTYDGLISLIARINLFKPREEVPCKMVSTDIPGCSKLIRSSDKSTITLCFRKPGGVHCEGGKAKSSNTCYISESDSWYCKEHFIHTYGKYGNVYSISVGHPEFKYWSDFMDKEYARLAGVKYQKLEKRKPPVQSKERFENCESALCYTGLTPYRKMVEDFAEAGLCKINELNLSVYDKDGYWVYDFEEFEERDPEAFSIFSILKWLNDSELYTARKIIEKYIDEEEIMGGQNLNLFQ